MSGLDELEKTLGIEALIRFLEHSIPLFRENFSVLLDALEKQRWQEAADMAHKMQATALIFSTQAFNDALNSVKKQDRKLIEDAAFQTNLKIQTAGSLQKICDKYQIH